MPTAKKSPVTAKKAAPVKVPAKKAAAAKQTFKAPKNLGAAADKFYELRQERLTIAGAATKQIEPIQKEESFLREHLIELLPASDATGVAGKLVRVSIKKGTEPVAEDWPKIYAHIVEQYLAAKKKKNGLHDGAFALLNRALNSATVKEMWDAGAAVPGVGKFQTKSLSVNKL